MLTAVVLVLQVSTGARDQEHDSGQISRPVEFEQPPKSEADIRALIAAAEALHGHDSPDFSVAIDGLVSSLLRQGVANSDQTLALAERAVLLKRRLRGTLDPQNATPLENLGRIYNLRGEYRLAVPSLKEGCSLRERSAVDEISPADCLEALALALIRTSRLQEAEGVVDRAMRIREAGAESDPAALSRTLGLFALLHRWAGRYDASRMVLDRAFAAQQQLGERDGNLVSLLLLKGDLQWLAGDLPQARETYASSVASAPDLLRRGSLDSLVAQRRLALAEDTLGNASSALALAEEARRIGDTALAPCHDERASISNDLAVIAENRGDYSTARAFYERSFAEKKRCARANGADIVTPMLNLASLAETMGDIAEAERLFGEVHQSWSSRYGADHPFVALSIDGLARVSLVNGRMSQARRLWIRALNLRSKALGPEHTEVAWTLTNLGQAATSAGDTAEAMRYLDQSIQIYQRAQVSDHPDRFARLMAARGSLFLKLGNPESARDSFSEALASRQRNFGATHPLTAEAQVDVALADALTGRSDLALTSALTAEQAGRSQLRSTISYLPERQSLMYAAVRPRGLDLSVSIAASTNVVVSDILDSLVRSRAVVLDELAVRSHVRKEDSQLASLRAALTRARQRMANLSMRSLRDREPTPADILEAARAQVEHAERALADASAGFRREQSRAEAGLADVRRALPRGSALVSFLRYEQTSFAPKSGTSTAPLRTVTSYAAFVTTTIDESVSLIPLGAAVSLDALVARWRKAASQELRTSEREYRNLATALRQRVWDPVAARLGEASEVFIVPDGAINLVSFGALPLDDRYLMESLAAIHYVSAERDLLAGGETHASGGFFAVGGPDFEDRVAAPRAMAAAAGARLNTEAQAVSGCEGFQSIHFGALPETGGEVQDIDRVWRSVHGDVTAGTVVLTGRAASEAAVKRGVAGRRIVHLATHGFFLDGGCRPARGNTRAVGGLTTSGSSSRVAAPAESPLLLSGLAFAGANRHATANSDEDDGILTAEEVASLDLDGVEWAVLSACDTGLGEIKAGEGVFGLRRAFQIAGARTVIMSLWSVDDGATRQWMRALYEGRLQRHLSTSQAVREASLSVLESRRAKNLSTHPFYWAAFVAAGDWR